MNRTLGTAVSLIGVTLIAFAPFGCGGHGVRAGHGGSGGTPTTAHGPDGGPGMDGAQPLAGETAASGGASGSGGAISSGGASATVSTGNAGNTAGGLAGAMTSSYGGTSGGGDKTSGSTMVGGSPSTTGGMSAGGTTGKTSGNSSNSAGGTTSKTGGNSSTGGVGGLGGSSANGGNTGGPTCLAHETEWKDSTGPSRCVATFVSVPGFAIDATEVTRGQYAAWLKTNPPSSGQPTVCAWNTTFTPDATCMADKSVCQGAACDTHPQPCVDHCDAAAYCKAIGRGLCTDANWLKTCTSDGAYEAVYGTSWARNKCNEYTIFGTTTVPVASMDGCQAPASSAFTGVFDLIGNLEEWVDSCRTSEGSGDSCPPRGLPFGMGAAAPLCENSIYAKRSQASPTLGFRCCTP